MKSGFVSLVGRPNAGKSTLLNEILERKVAITSHVGGTTRNIIQGVYNDEDSQIIFIDLPGVHKPKDKLGVYMNRKVYAMMEEVDLILFLVDATMPIGKGDMLILEKIKSMKKPVFLIINKVDLLDKVKLLELIVKYKDIYPFNEIVPVSAKKGDNIKDLLKTIKRYLTGSDKLYDEEYVTNVSKEFLIAEIVREKVLRLTHEEVPHSVTCVVENMEELEDIIDINVLVIVDRDNLKKIIIGKKGQMLKKVGTYARVEIEELLGKKVFLQTHVKTVDSWREKETFLKELGLNEL